MAEPEPEPEPLEQLYRQRSKLATVLADEQFAEKDGVVDSEEFAMVLGLLGIDAVQEPIASLITRFTADGGEQVDYDALLAHVATECKPAAELEREALLAQQREGMVQEFVAIRATDEGTARTFLETAGWGLTAAIDAHLCAEEERKRLERQQAQLVAEFCAAFPGAEEALARERLQAAGWDLARAEEEEARIRAEAAEAQRKREAEMVAQFLAAFQLHIASNWLEKPRARENLTEAVGRRFLESAEWELDKAVEAHSLQQRSRQTVRHNTLCDGVWALVALSC